MKLNKVVLSGIVCVILSDFIMHEHLLSKERWETQTTTPINEPAKVTWDGSCLLLDYNGHLIFKAEIENAGKEIDFRKIIDEQHGIINQVLKWTSRRESLQLTGLIFASDESFPCESDRKREGPDIVRHSVGLSHSLLNRAVYDRKSDWVLSVDFPSKVIIVPGNDSEHSNVFKIIVTGRDIILRFRPHFYQKHRGLIHFKPWAYRVWKKPVVGWCSWFAYFENITEENIKKTADVLSEVLVPFGLEYLQIDDGYQQSPAGLPETWLNPNDKFPSGLRNLSQYILHKALKPGIWTYTSFHQKDFAESHKQLFVPDESGNPAYGNWVGYILDGSNPETIEKIIRPLYRGLREMGWKYYKVDALRHLRYEGYNSHSQYFKEKNIDLVATYRDVVKMIREEIGEESFMLGCWGIRPELIGIIDGCRIGGDGFGYAGLAQYNSFNNVIWRNDPDHIELSPEEAHRSSMVTSLTGSLFMLTDKPELYKTALVEPAKRSVPVLFTVPGQIFDVDPSRSSSLHLVASELSGDGIRSFDSDRTPRCHLYLLEMNKDFENWMLLGRTGGDIDRIRFKHLGLSEDNEYLVFEFWSKKLLGSFSEVFYTEDIQPKYNCQLFCIRERKSHPQIIATNRHITCGGLELDNVIWKKEVLSGESELVGHGPYVLYVSEPDGYTFEEMICRGVEIIGNQKRGIVRTIQIKNDEQKRVNWYMKYSRR